MSTISLMRAGAAVAGTRAVSPIAAAASSASVLLSSPLFINPIPRFAAAIFVPTKARRCMQGVERKACQVVLGLANRLILWGFYRLGVRGIRVRWAGFAGRLR